MSKHTAGPWEVLNAGKHWNNKELDNLQITAGYPEDKRMRENVTELIYTPEDATLIAQAPALLKALNALRFSSQLNTGQGPTNDTYWNDIETAKAVIKAAEGEQLSDSEQQLIDDLWEQ